ncbi:MAG: thiamine phosphate synthase [Candidatus Omnitrophota bacterium]
MKPKKNLLKNSRLYLILDKDVCGEKRLIPVLSRALKGGVDVVQFRDKTSSVSHMIRLAGPLAELTRRHGRIFIVNDRPEVARAVLADGIHVGQEDSPVEVLREFLGNDLLIGLSCHSLCDLKRAQDLPIDYAGFGPVFPTQTKPLVKARGTRLLKKALALCRLPVFAIGGIEKKTLSIVMAAGARRIACCREICLAENPDKTAAILKSALSGETCIKN